MRVCCRVLDIVAGNGPIECLSIQLWLRRPSMRSGQGSLNNPSLGRSDGLYIDTLSAAGLLARNRGCCRSQTSVRLFGLDFIFYRPPFRSQTWTRGTS